MRSDSAKALMELGRRACRNSSKVLERGPQKHISCLRRTRRHRTGCQSRHPALLKLLDAESGVMRRHAVAALGKIHGMPDVVIPQLISRALRYEQSVRENARQGAGELWTAGRTSRMRRWHGTFRRTDLPGAAGPVRMRCEIGPQASAAVPALGRRWTMRRVL